MASTGSVSPGAPEEPCGSRPHSRPTPGQGAECVCRVSWGTPPGQLQDARSQAHVVAAVDTRCPAEQEGVWRPRKPTRFQEAPCPPWGRQQGEPPDWQGDEGPVAFSTRERPDQRKSISFWKNCSRDMPGRQHSERSWATWPLGGCLSSAKFLGQEKGDFLTAQL